MEKITDNKIVYETVKGLKSIFTKLTAHKIQNIYFRGLEFLFEPQDLFILKGSLIVDADSKSEFFKWLQGDERLGIPAKEVSTTIEDLAKIAKCLKKNASAIEYSDNTFKFYYLDGEEEKYVEFNNETVSVLFEKVDQIEEMIELEYEVPEEISKKSVFHIFLNEETNQFSGEADDENEKVLEIPTKKLNALLSTENLKLGCSRVSFFDAGEIGYHLFRYVRVSSSIEGISLTQYFATV